MPTKTIERVALRRLCVLTFFAAWLLRLGIAFALDRQHDFYRKDMEVNAIHLLKHGSIGGELAQGMPSAMEPPGYILVLAAIFRVFGTGVLAETVKIVTCTAASALRCALAVWLASRLNLGKAVAVTVALLSVFWIGAFETELQGNWDAPYTACMVILLAGLHYRKPVMSAGLRWAMAVGLLWGACLYFTSSILTILAGFLAVEFWRTGRASFGAFSARVACIAGCIFLVLLPWGIRNRITMGAWIFTRTGLGYTVGISYHDGAHWSDAMNNDPGGLRRISPEERVRISPNPRINPREARRALEMGELAYDDMYLRAGLTWIRQNPSQALLLVAQHTLYFWFPPGPDFYSGLYPGLARRALWIYAAVKWGLTLFSFAGLALLWNRNRMAAMHLGSMLAMYPLMYYLMNWSSRYRSPIEWVLVLLTALPVALAWERFLDRERRHAGERVGGSV